MKFPKDLNYIKISPELLNSYEVYKLSDREFLEEFEKAINNEPSVMSEFVIPQCGRLPRNDWDEIKARVYERDGKVCSYCHTQDGPFHVDHILPLSRGGANDLDNLTVACASCNQSKSNKTVKEWRGDELV